jgi:hypothetical protein
VDVILDSADVAERAFRCADDSAEVSVRPIGDILRDPRLAALGGKDDVEEGLASTCRA